MCSYYYHFVRNYAFLSDTPLLWQQIHVVRLQGGIVEFEQRFDESSSIRMRQPTQIQIADELIFSRGAAPASGLHVGLTGDVEQISLLIQQAFLLRN